jgi:hypothetical protein
MELHSQRFLFRFLVFFVSIESFYCLKRLNLASNYDKHPSLKENKKRNLPENNKRKIIDFTIFR